jgi:hypothetical protein
VVAQAAVAQEIIQAAQVVQAVALLERMVLAEHWYQEVQLLLLVKATLAATTAPVVTDHLAEVLEQQVIPVLAHLMALMAVPD